MPSIKMPLKTHPSISKTLKLKKPTSEKVGLHILLATSAAPLSLYTGQVTLCPLNYSGFTLFGGWSRLHYDLLLKQYKNCIQREENCIQKPYFLKL